MNDFFSQLNTRVFDRHYYITKSSLFQKHLNYELSVAKISRSRENLLRFESSLSFYSPFPAIERTRFACVYVSKKF